MRFQLSRHLFYDQCVCACLWVFLCVRLSVSPTVSVCSSDVVCKHIPVCVLFCLFFCLRVCLFVCLPVCLSVWMYVWMYLCMYGWMDHHGCMYEPVRIQHFPFILPVYLPVHLSVSLCSFSCLPTDCIRSLSFWSDEVCMSVVSGRKSVFCGCFVIRDYVNIAYCWNVCKYVYALHIHVYQIYIYAYNWYGLRINIYDMEGQIKRTITRL